MSSFNPPSSLTGALRRRIEIVETESSFIVTPAARSTLAFEAFPLPKCRRRVVDWLFTLGNASWKQHDRAIGAVLALDVASHQWAAILPHQSLGSDSPTLHVASADFDDLPETAVLAGSFQVVRAIEPERFDEAVPVYAGLHFLLVMQGEGRGAWSFVRTANDCHQIKRKDIVEEDWEATLEAYESRLHLI